MSGVFRHELRAYRHSPLAFIVIGLFALLASIYFYADNIRTRTGDLSSLYSTVGTLFLFIVPILSARVIAEERRSGMDILLFTSPTKIHSIVIGKFLALYALLVAMIALTIPFPLLLTLFTSPHPLSLFGCYIGLLLLAASLASFGIFVSSITDSQVAAAIISFVSLLALLLMRPLGAAVGGAVSHALNWISPFSRFDELSRGVLSVPTALYFAMFTFLWLFFTVVLIARKHRGGEGQAYAFVNAVSVAAIAVVIVLFAEMFPVQLDLSTGKRYSIGDTTTEALSDLDTSIEIIGLFDDGKADADYIEIRELLKRYSNAADGHISVSYIDPDRDTKILERLDASKTLGLRKNDFYVASDTASRRIQYKDLFEMEYDNKTSTWFNTGSTAESAFTTAIKAVASPEASDVYFVTDHAEAYTELRAALEKEGNTIRLANADEIPDAAAALVFIAPGQDLTEAQQTELEAFLYSGGGLLVLFDAPGSYPNWNGLLSQYSLQLTGMYTAGAISLDVPESEIIPLDFSDLNLSGAAAIGVREGAAALIEHNGSVYAAASELKNAKVLVTGNAAFVSDSEQANSAANFAMGSYFVSASLDWLTAEPEALPAEVKSFDTGELQISDYKADYIAFLTIAVLPLAIFLRGFAIWKRRRFL
jgi:ABC-2 type transport system permease protein